MSTKLEITEADAGCWLDGSQGWHNAYRIVDRAEAYGFEVSADDRKVLDLYASDDQSATVKLSTGKVVDYELATECVVGQRELADKAFEYLDERAPEGYAFVRDAGELSLVEDCGHDNCETGLCYQGA